MVAMATHVRGRTLPHLKAWRLERFISQSELAERAGMGKSTVARAEEGDKVVSFANIRKLAQALDVSVEQLTFTAPKERPAQP